MGRAGFSISVRHRGQTSVIACAGELDLLPAEKLREAFEACLDGKPDHVVVDCSELTLLSSAGITALVDTAIRCRELGIPLDLRFSPHARKILDLVGLWWLGVIHDGVSIHEALQQALRAYAEEKFAGNLDQDHPAEDPGLERPSTT